MVKFKTLSVILSLTMATGILMGCGKSTATVSTEKLVDGVYKVEYEDFDSHDYKGQLELTISAAKITDVNYDEVKKDGTFKSKDESYKKSMEEQSKTYPEKAYNELKEQLIEKQSSTLDAVSGATASSNNFKALVKYALDDMAVKRTTTPEKIKEAK